VSGELVVLLTDAQLDALAERVAAKIQNGNGNGNHAPVDRLFTAEEAAAVLGVKVRWLYGHASELPFVVKLPNSRAVRYSERGLMKWLARRQG
jgi:hypothetical protein